MSLFQITLAKDSAWQVMMKLGETRSCHFIDLMKSENFNLSYSRQLKQAEETIKNMV